MAKSLSVLIIVLLIGDLAICQVRFARYFQESLLPTIDNKSYPEVKFAWNMAGKTQAAMNNGLAELGEDNPDVAIHNFDEVIQQLPTFLPAFYYRGVCYKLLEDFDKAQKDFEAAIAIDPKSSETWILLGEIYQQRFKLEKAESCYDKAIGINPTFIRGYFNLSMVEFTRGNTRKSIKYIEKCHELDPKFPNAYLMEGLIKFKELSKNKNKNAIVYFDQAIRCDSLYREALFWRGLSYVYLEQPAKAIGDWDKLVLYNPENPFFVPYGDS